MSTRKGIGVIYPLVSGTKGSAARAATIRHLEAGNKTLSGVQADLKRTQAPPAVCGNCTGGLWLTWASSGWRWSG